MAGSAWTNQVQSLLIIQSGGNFQGLFVYSPTIGAGNLVSSIAAAAGTDPFTNPYLAGIVSYTPGKNGTAYTQMQSGIINLTDATYTAPATIQVSTAALQLFSAQNGAGDKQALLSLFSTVESNAGIPVVQVEGVGATQGELTIVGGGIQPTAIAGTAALWVNNSSNPKLFALSASGGQGVVETANVDTTHNTVTQAVATTLFGNFVVPAADANAGTTYRLKSFGGGTQGSTQQTLLITWLGFSILFPTTLAGISQAFSWDSEAEYRVVTTGVSGTIDAKIAFTIQDNATISATNQFKGVQASAGRSFNTAIANTIVVQATWGSTTGAPTITSFGSTFERVG